MCCIQMMIVTGGYDGSQDVASTEVIDFSGQEEKHLIRQEQGGEMVWRKVWHFFEHCAQISFVQIIVQIKYQLKIELPCQDWTGLRNSDGGIAIHLLPPIWAWQPI